MAYMDILELPSEIAENIYSYCSVCDLLNLATCCSKLHGSVKYTLWKVIRVPWRALVKGALPDYVGNFRSTSVLTICDDYDEENNGDLNNTESQIVNKGFKCHNRNKSNLWLKFFINYKQLIRSCNPYRLRRFDVEDLPIKLDLKLTIRFLPNVEALYFTSGVSYNWKLLPTLKNLKKLSFEKCDIDDAGIKDISKCPKLEHLELKVCVKLRDESFRHLANLRGIQSFLICNNTSVSGDAFKNLQKLQKLTHLHIESATNVNNESLQTLSKHLSNLRTLKLIGCSNITNNGFIHISSLGLLSELNINMCWRITAYCFYYIKSIPALEKLFFTSVNQTDVALAHLGELKKLKEVWISNLDHQFCDAIVEKFCKQMGMSKEWYGSKVSYKYSRRKYQTVSLKKL